MADITLGDLIALILTDLADTLQQTAEQAQLLRLHVSDLDVDIPAHLRLPAEGSLKGSLEEPARLMVTLPSTRETPAPGRLGRVRITFGRAPPRPPQDLPPQEPLP